VPPQRNEASLLPDVVASGGVPSVSPSCACLPRRQGRPAVSPTEEITVSDEPTQDRPDEADETTQKPGEQDTETEGGQPKEAPESEKQSKQNE